MRRLIGDSNAIAHSRIISLWKYFLKLNFFQKNSSFSNVSRLSIYSKNGSFYTFVRFNVMSINLKRHETFDRKASFMGVSFKLIEAIRLFVFIERDLAALNGHGPTLDPEVLARNRRALDQRIAQVAALIDTDEELMEHPALAAEMVWLFDEVRASLSRHQERWPPESAAADIEGYRASAEELQQRSNAFRLWCDTNLNY